MESNGLLTGLLAVHRLEWFASENGAVFGVLGVRPRVPDGLAGLVESSCPKINWTTGLGQTNHMILQLSCLDIEVSFFPFVLFSKRRNGDQEGLVLAGLFVNLFCSLPSAFII
ncbi:MAG: hypothetical protein ACYS9C_17240 [Planctomycetota bacterium]|jgi:hypothetical protein